MDFGGVVVDSNIKKLKFKVQPQVIEILGEINSELASDFAEQVKLAQVTGQTVIPVYIRSLGGDPYSYLDIRDTIKRSKVPVATIATGLNASAAACIWCCAPEELRFMGPGACLMFHSVSSNRYGSINTAGIEVEAKETSRVNKVMMETLEQDLNLSAGFFRKTFKNNGNTDLYIDTKRAKEFGLVINDYLPEFVTEVKVEYKFTNPEGLPISLYPQVSDSEGKRKSSYLAEDSGSDEESKSSHTKAKKNKKTTDTNQEPL